MSGGGGSGHASSLLWVWRDGSKSWRREMHGMVLSDMNHDAFFRLTSYELIRKLGLQTTSLSIHRGVLLYKYMHMHGNMTMNMNMSQQSWSHFLS